MPGDAGWFDPMTPLERDQLKALRACRFSPGSAAKRFVRDLSAWPEDRRLTKKGAPQQVRPFWGTPTGGLGGASIAEACPTPGMAARTTRRHGGNLLETVSEAMWPTPAASLPNDGEDPETFFQRQQQQKARGINGNGMGTPRAIAAKASLIKQWPTPNAADDRNRGNAALWARRAEAGKQISLSGAVKLAWPTPTAADGPGGPGAGASTGGGPTLRTAVTAWPTPRASPNENRQTRLTPSQKAGEHGPSLAAVANWATPRADGFDAGAHRGAPDSLHAQVKLWPTPMSRDEKDTGDMSRVNAREGRPPDTVARLVQATDPERSIEPLNPEFVELLMGFPVGWTEVP